MNRLLNSPKFLNSAAIAVAVIGILLIVVGIATHFDSQLNKPVTVASKNGVVSVQGQNREIGLDYGEEFYLNSGVANLEWTNSQAILTVGGTSGVTDLNTLQILSGAAYVSSSSNFSITSSEGIRLSGEEFSAYVTAKPFKVTIMSGFLSDDQGNTYGLSQTVSYISDRFETSRFDRTNLSRQEWRDVISALSSYGVTDSWLEDLTPPTVVETIPEDGTVLDETRIEMSIRVNEANTRVNVNGSEGIVDENNEISLVLSLSEGANEIKIVTRDEIGNESETTIQYSVVLPEPEPEPEQKPISTTTNNNSNNTSNQTASCSDGAFRQSLASLINQHRQDNGLGSLSLSNSLNTAACKHSIFMANSGNLTHTGSGGSSFNQRCTAEGTSCDAENVAWASPTLTAQQTFNQWKNSDGHNQNMLGTHTQIGIGFKNNYATAVFF